MKKLFHLFGFLILLIFGYYAIVFFRVKIAFERDKIPNDLVFDRTAWQDGTARERGQMVNYLLDSIGIVNKTKEELTYLIGEPDKKVVLEGEELPFLFYYWLDKGHAYHYDMIIFFDSLNIAKEVLFDD
ncbi:MAG: hypothetical protein AAFO07_02050 [Bacteroidota bacterium]